MIQTAFTIPAGLTVLIWASKNNGLSTDYRKDSEYEPFLGLSVGFRF